MNAAKLGAYLKQNNQKIATAESCTGGWLAQEITGIAGSSAWFERGFVTYSNEAKMEMLGVKEATLQQFGAVSERTACEMAEGALRSSYADVAVSITGIAGPDGGSDKKPVGTVWFGFARKGTDTHAVLKCFSGDRASVRQQSVEFVIDYVMNLE